MKQEKEKEKNLLMAQTMCHALFRPILVVAAFHVAYFIYI